MFHRDIGAATVLSKAYGDFVRRDGKKRINVVLQRRLENPAVV
jgi:hypothetical protein